MDDRNSLPDDQQEGPEDAEIGSKQFSAVISATDWTVSTVLQQIDRGNIELNPRFQRREAWRDDRKSGFIESLILNVPVPQIVLAEKADRRGQFIVIDGKQRLLTLRQFAAPEGDTAYTSFALTKLAVRKDLNRTTFAKLRSDAALESDLTAFENSTIRTAVIRNWNDEDFLYTVFLRLNTGSVPLSPQELRQALHPGPFVEWVDEYSLDAKALHEVMGISKPDVRMRDAELVIRYFAFRDFLSTYTGNLKPLLDETAKQLNARWRIDGASVQARREDFERALHVGISVFGPENAFRKWSGKKYETALNRAVFDAMAVYFGQKKLADKIIGAGIAVEAAFRDLCANNSEFRSSIEGTTKSIQSIYTRLHTWGEALQRAIGSPVGLPKMEDNHIVLAQ